MTINDVLDIIRSYIGRSYYDDFDGVSIEYAAGWDAACYQLEAEIIRAADMDYNDH